MEWPQHLLADPQCLLEQRPGLVEVAAPPDHCRQAAEGDGVVGVTVAEGLFADGERLPQQHFGLVAVVQEEAKLGEHAQAGGIVGVVSPECLRLPSEQPPDHVFGMLVSSPSIQPLSLAPQPTDLVTEWSTGVGECGGERVPGVFIPSRYSRRGPTPWKRAPVATSLKLVRMGRDHEP